MLQTTTKKIITGSITILAFYIYQSLTFRQTLLSETPGANPRDHIWNIAIYMIIMFLEFFILILGYDTVVNIFSIDFMRNHELSISIASLIIVASSLTFGVCIFQENFINAVNEYFKNQKNNLESNINLLNNQLSSMNNVFPLTLMCALFAFSLAIFISAIIELCSKWISSED